MPQRGRDRRRLGEWRLGAVAALPAFLAACGGDGTQPASQSAQIVVPASSVAAPSRVVSTQAAGGSPAPSATVPSVVTPASSPAAASAPVSASAPLPASTPVVKIAIYGDDEMMGVSFSSMGMPTFVKTDEAQALQALLQKRFNDTGITVIDAASGGLASTLPNELDGMDGGGAAEPQRMEQSGAVIVIQEHAINDNRGGETADEYAAYLRQWIGDAQTAGVTPVLEEPGPVCDSDHPRLGQYVAAMDAAAIRYHVPIISQYDVIASLNGWQAHTLGCITPDSQLAAVKAAQDEAVIEPLVAKIIGSQS